MFLRKLRPSPFHYLPCHSKHSLHQDKLYLSTLLGNERPAACIKKTHRTPKAPLTLTPCRQTAKRLNVYKKKHCLRVFIASGNVMPRSIMEMLRSVCLMPCPDADHASSDTPHEQSCHPSTTASHWTNCHSGEPNPGLVGGCRSPSRISSVLFSACVVIVSTTPNAGTHKVLTSGTERSSARKLRVSLNDLCRVGLDALAGE